MSFYFVQDNFELTLSDVDDYYLQRLKNKFHSVNNVKEILLLDLERADFRNDCKHIESHFDTIVLLNVLEHVKNDQVAVQNCRYLLRKGGSLVILVPAYSWLYARLDKKLGHYHRYTLSSLSDIFYKNELTIRKRFYFNAMGIVAWLYAKIFGLSIVPAAEMKIYDKIVPFARFVDRVVLRKIGLSAVIIGEK